MRNKNNSEVMALPFAAMLVIMQFAGCVSIGGEPIEHEIAAAREMVFEAMQNRIEKLDEDRAFYFRKEKWPWMSRPSDLRCLSREIDWIRFREVKPEDDPPDDERFGNELIDLLRKCKIDDAVSFGSISNRIVSTVGLAWFGKGGSSLAGIAAITDDNVYFIYTLMYEEECCCEFGVLRNPPYYMWRNPYLIQYVGLYPKSSEDHRKFDRMHSRVSQRISKIYPGDQLYHFLFENFTTAFRMDVSPEKFNRR
jgi:hypothetical protein